MSTLPRSGLPPSDAGATPAITVSSIDLARLEAMLQSPALRNHPTAELLQRELDRAEVLPPDAMPPDVVRMHTVVECEDADGAPRHLTLVYPQEADVAKGHVSVLAPVGAALLGLSIGQCIDWPTPGGVLRLRVTSVQPFEG
ncbi:MULTISPECIES: nucleoside diphosphate kinase regulator [unclassified Luteimonas]|uniref:nucleoside diphosphate kinase regulator n=1 Tax=unclassified Luteimonas TaxID=2629088 RepID=UPI0016207258|nr:nucleoside diphosphate kinase regulator [Luteimonas sp. RC10]MBB3345409.1 regulator of nucleoside diphosphate kinase [Luteimonas sp. RC10]